MGTPYTPKKTSPCHLWVSSLAFLSLCEFPGSLPTNISLVYSSQSSGSVTRSRTQIRVVVSMLQVHTEEKQGGNSRTSTFLFTPYLSHDFLRQLHPVISLYPFHIARKMLYLLRSWFSNHHV